MTKFKTLALLLIATSGCICAQGQLAPMVSEICHIIHPNGWILFKSHLDIPAQKVFVDYKPFFGLGADDEMRLYRIDTSQTGFVNYRYQQFYKGIPLEGVEFILHEKNGRTVKGNGLVIPFINKSVPSLLRSQTALEIVLKNVQPQSLLLADSASIHELKLDRGGISDHFFPRPVLQWSFPDIQVEFNAAALRLVYTVAVSTANPWRRTEVMVDAESGTILASFDLTTGCSDATAMTQYNGQKTNLKVSASGSDYILLDDCQDTDIHTRSIDAHPAIATKEQIEHEDLAWPDDDDHNPYVQAHWSTRMTYEYFEDAFDYHGYDDANSTMHTLVGSTVGTNYYPGHGVALQNPIYNPVGLSDWPTSLDVVGHEWTHAITNELVQNIVTVGETGGLYESFGDIFGSMVECYGKDTYLSPQNNDCEDFTLFEEHNTSASIRDMREPHNKNHPDTYCGTYWLNGTDLNGIHALGGVQNKWFSLLALGQSTADTNDHCCSPATYQFNGIGRDKAALVAWTNLKDYITARATYVDAKLGAMSAADDLESNGDITSTDESRVEDAWDAVGVYSTVVNWEYYPCETYTPTSQPKRLLAVESITTASNSCSGTIVEDGAEMEYRAGKFIRLRPKFRAESGCEFRAITDNKCDIIALTKTAPPLSDENRNFDMSSPARVSQEVNVVVAPNPSTSTTHVWVSTTSDRVISIELIDGLGRSLDCGHQNIAHVAGVRRYDLDTSKIPNGAYVCSVVTYDSRASTQIMVLK